MRKIQLVVSALLLILLLVACAPKAAPAPPVPTGAEAPAPAPAPAAPVPATPVRPAWQGDWEQTLAAAKKEGVVMIATSVSGHRTEMAPLFKEKYGVTVEFIVGESAVVSPKILAERRAGIYSFDIFITGGVTLFTIWKPAGAVDPLEPILILPEVTDPKGWWGNKLLWIDQDHTQLMSLATVQPMLAINTNLVKPQELKSYRDLLNPRWKGKVLLSNPFSAGQGSKGLIIIGKYIMGWDYMRELAKNEPVIVTNVAQGRDWLALGKVAIVISPLSSAYTEAIRLGAPIGWHTPEEGTYLDLSGGVLIFNRRPHPNATKVFVNWFFTREGATAQSRITGNQSAREDVPTDFVAPVMTRKPGAKYILGGSEELAMEQAAMAKTLAEIFAAK